MIQINQCILEEDLNVSMWKKDIWVVVLVTCWVKKHWKGDIQFKVKKGPNHCSSKLIDNKNCRKLCLSKRFLGILDITIIQSKNVFCLLLAQDWDVTFHDLLSATFFLLEESLKFFLEHVWNLKIVRKLPAASGDTLYIDISLMLTLKGPRKL